MGHEYDDHDYATQESPDVLVEVAADFIDTINEFWYDPYLLNKKSNNSDDHGTVNVDQGHHDEDHDNLTRHEQQNNSEEVNETNQE